jgi:hypothetical protein
MSIVSSAAFLRIEWGKLVHTSCLNERSFSEEILIWSLRPIAAVIPFETAQ